MTALKFNLPDLAVLGQPGAPQWPLAPAARALASLETVLEVDAPWLELDLPRSLEAMGDALQGEALGALDGLAPAYASIRDLLQASPLLALLASGSIPEAFEPVLAAAEDLARRRAAALAEDLFGVQTLAAAQAALADLKSFAAAPPADQAALMAFLGRQVAGIALDPAAAPAQRMAAALAALAIPEQEQIELRVGAVAEAYLELEHAIGAADAVTAAGCARVSQALDAVIPALNALLPLLEQALAAAVARAAAYPWAGYVDELGALLGAVEVPERDAVGAAIELLEEAFASTLDALERAEPEILRDRIAAMGEQLYETFAVSSIGAARATIGEAIEELRLAVESLPLADLAARLRRSLKTIKAELEALPITEARDELTQALNEQAGKAEQWLTGEVLAPVEGRLTNLVAQLPDSAGLLGELQSVIDTVSTWLGKLPEDSDSRLATLRTWLETLDTISFTPVVDLAVREIEALHEQAAQMPPDALSSEERLLIMAGAAALETFDLDGVLLEPQRRAFTAATASVRELLGQAEGQLERIDAQLGAVDGRALIESARRELERLDRMLGALDVGRLLLPLSAQVERGLGRLAEVAPGRLLEPLKEPYGRIHAHLERLDPERWTAGLGALAGEIGGLIDAIDPSILLEQVAARQRALLDELRDATIAALDALDLPAPLAALVKALRPLLGAISGDLFAYPGAELQRLAEEARAQLSPVQIFQTLDAPFDELLAALRAAPRDQLTGAANGARETLIGLLDALNTTRQGGEYDYVAWRLRDLAPDLLLGAERLAALRLSFAARVGASASYDVAGVATVEARFAAAAAVATPLSPSAPARRLERLYQQFEAQTLAALERMSDARLAESCERLSARIGAMAPPLLLRRTALSYDDIFTGLEALRPSRRAAGLAPLVERLSQRAAALELELADAIEAFYNSVDATVGLVSPLTLADDLRPVFAALRAQAALLDPTRLAADLRREVYLPLRDTLDAWSIEGLQATLDEAYQGALQKVGDQVRAALAALRSQLEMSLKLLRDKVSKLLEGLEEALDKLLEDLDALRGQYRDLVFVGLIGRLRALLDRLEQEFDREVGRLRTAFFGLLDSLAIEPQEV